VIKILISSLKQLASALTKETYEKKTIFRFKIERMKKKERTKDRNWKI
jgi:hypothetical protein